MGLTPTAGLPAIYRSPARRGACETPLHADVLCKGARSRNYARLDFHLLRLAIQLANQVIDRRNHRGNVTDDQLVRTVIGKDVAARREELFQSVLHRCGFGIAQERVSPSPVPQLPLAPFPSLAWSRLPSLACRGWLRAARCRTELFVQTVVLQHDIQRLVPGHFIQNDRQRSLYVGIQHHVQPADLVNQTEESPSGPRPSGSPRSAPLYNGPADGRRAHLCAVLRPAAIVFAALFAVCGLLRRLLRCLCRRAGSVFSVMEAKTTVGCVKSIRAAAKRGATTLSSLLACACSVVCLLCR